MTSKFVASAQVISVTYVDTFTHTGCGTVDGPYMVFLAASWQGRSSLSVSIALAANNSNILYLILYCFIASSDIFFTSKGSFLLKFYKLCSNINYRDACRNMVTIIGFSKLSASLCSAGDIVPSVQ